LSDAMDLAHIVYWEQEPTTGELILNDPYYKLCGTDAITEGGYRIGGKEYTIRFVHPDDRHLVTDFIQQGEIHRNREFLGEGEHRIVRRDGQVRHIFARVRRTRDAEGRTVRIYGANQDITERKQAEEVLKRYELLSANSRDIILFMTWEGNILEANTAALAAYGYTREELLQVSIKDLRAPEVPSLLEQQLLAADGWGMLYEAVHRRKDGSTFPVEVSSRSAAVNGKHILINITRDITERKKLEQQLLQAQKMEAIGTLAGGVAHDFNNMLSVILGYSQLIMKTMEKDSDLYGFIDEIEKAANRSADITRQLLAFARKQTISPTTLNLNDTIEAMLKMLRRLIGEDIELAWLPGTTLLPVRMDPSQIDQILANLMVNARDAITDTGKITIETDNTSLSDDYCAAHPGFIPGNYVVLSVSDDGQGMNKETLNRIFEPFFTTKKAGEGTGLGLSTVYGIVKQNEGFVNVYSEPGKGTTFRIYLRSQDERGVEDRPAVPTAMVAADGETILVVEDEVAILALAEKFLTGLGYTVLAANRPEKALEIAQNYPNLIDLLMTDVVMPGMNGKELSEELLKSRPDLKCLFMSGYTSNAIVHRGVLDKDVYFIQKPFSLNDLAAKVRAALEGQE
jgi:two-component system, cell cycle sensor histidine kinase and response regulator CckA